MPRPISEVTKKVLADLAIKPHTSAEICQKHNLKNSAGRMLLKRLVESERAAIVEKVLQSHCKKPVPIYSLKTKEFFMRRNISIIISAPKGAGKTVNAEVLRHFFGMERVVDECTKLHELKAGDLALTSHECKDEDLCADQVYVRFPHPLAIKRFIAPLIFEQTAD